MACEVVLKVWKVKFGFSEKMLQTNDVFRTLFLSLFFSCQRQDGPRSSKPMWELQRTCAILPLAPGEIMIQGDVQAAAFPR